MRGGLWFWAASALLLAGLSGCSAIVDPDVGKLGAPPPPACTPTRIVNCACSGGVIGTQVCNQSGTFDTCRCGTAGTRASAGTGGAGSGGAGRAGGGGKGKN